MSNLFTVCNSYKFGVTFYLIICIYFKIKNTIFHEIHCMNDMEYGLSSLRN